MYHKPLFWQDCSRHFVAHVTENGNAETKSNSHAANTKGTGWYQCPDLRKKQDKNNKKVNGNDKKEKKEKKKKGKKEVEYNYKPSPEDGGHDPEIMNLGGDEFFV